MKNFLYTLLLSFSVSTFASGPVSCPSSFDIAKHASFDSAYQWFKGYSVSGAVNLNSDEWKLNVKNVVANSQTDAISAANLSLKSERLSLDEGPDCSYWLYCLCTYMFFVENPKTGQTDVHELDLRYYA